MAGSAREVIQRIHRRRPALYVAGLLCITALALSREQRAAVVLLEHPDRFVLLNKYQQRLTTGEYRALPQTMAAVLVRETDRLSDAITPCSVVEYEGSLLYIQREPQGGYTRRGGVGSLTLFRDARVYNDTIVLMGGAALRLQSPAAPGIIALRSGTRAVRLFSNGTQTFVRLVAPDARAGWIPLAELPAGRDWKLSGTRLESQPSSNSAMRRLTPVVAAANRSLSNVFRHLAGGRSNTAAASFRLEAGDDTLRCVVEPASFTHVYASSLAALLPEFERALTGTALHPELSGGAIVVPLR
jgi:hypothetical protein